MLSKLIREMILVLSNDEETVGRKYSLRPSEVEKLEDFITRDIQVGGLGKKNFEPARPLNKDERDAGKEAAKESVIIDFLLEKGYATVNGADSTAWIQYPGVPDVFLTTKIYDLISSRKKNKGKITEEEIIQYVKSSSFLRYLKTHILTEDEIDAMNSMISNRKSEWKATQKIFKNLSDDPTYSEWFGIISPLLEKNGKLEQFVRVMENIRTSLGGTEYIHTLIDAMMDINPEVFVSKLFTYDFTRGINTIPQEFRIIADINAYNGGGSAGHSVGRGEFVILLLSNEYAIPSGKNQNYDLLIGDNKWEVKYVHDTKKARISNKTAYSHSIVKDFLSDIQQTRRWRGTTPETTINKTNVSLNAREIESVFGSMQKFQYTLDDEMRRRVLSHLSGIIFMNNEYKMIVVPIDKCYCVGVENGNYIVSWIPNYFVQIKLSF